MKFHAVYLALLASIPALAKQEVRRQARGNGKGGKGSPACSASETENAAYNEIAALIDDGTCKQLDLSTLMTNLGLTEAFSADPFGAGRAAAFQAVILAAANCDLTGGRLVTPFVNADTSVNDILVEANVISGYAFCCPKCALDEELIMELCSASQGTGPGALGVGGAAGISVQLLDFTTTQTLGAVTIPGGEQYLCPAFLTDEYFLPPAVSQ